MIKNTHVGLALIAFLLISACKPAILPKRLYGKWAYTKVENPRMNPPDSISKSELNENKPYIIFKENQEFMINWGGKVLSHGSFTIDGDNIRIKEVLADGKVREFPFWVSKITDREIVFETMGEEGSKVTALKE